MRLQPLKRLQHARQLRVLVLRQYLHACSAVPLEIKQCMPVTVRLGPRSHGAMPGLLPMAWALHFTKQVQNESHEVHSRMHGSV